MQRVDDPADPRRCTGQTEHGQCMNVSEPGDDKCSAHHGKDSGRSKSVYLLHKAQYAKRLNELSNHEQLISLREEISLTKMLIEERVNLIKDNTDFLSAFGPLQQALLTVEKLTKSLHAMEQSLGNLLSKSAVVKLGQSLSQIIVEELRDVPNYEQIVDSINERMLTAIGELQNLDD